MGRVIARGCLRASVLRQIDACDRQIEAYLARLPARGDGAVLPQRTHRAKNPACQRPFIRRPCGAGSGLWRGPDGHRGIELMNLKLTEVVSDITVSV
jgi:hypothetical protein